MGIFDNLFGRKRIQALSKELDEYREIAVEMKEFADSVRQVTNEPTFTGTIEGIQTANSNQPPTPNLLKEQRGTVDTAINAVADRISDLELEVVKRMRNGEDRVLPDHDAISILTNNSLRDEGVLPLHNIRQQLRLTTQYMLGVGEAYWLKIRDQVLAKRTLRFMIVPPDVIEPVVRDGLIVAYEVTLSDGEKELIPASEFVRMWYPDPSNLYLARGSFGPQAIEYDARKYASQHSRSHFENDATPRVVLEGEAGATTPDDSTQRRAERAWNLAYNTRHGHSRGVPSRLPPGWKAHVLDLDQGEALTVKMLEHFDKHLLRTFKVPRSVLGDVSDAPARAAAETNQYVFDLYAVSPVTSMIIDALNQQWIHPEYGKEFNIQFREFVARDKEFELRRDESDLQNMTRSINEIREARRWNASSWGDLPVAKKNDRPYTGEIQEEEPPIPPNQPEDKPSDEGSDKEDEEN